MASRHSSVERRAAWLAVLILVGVGAALRLRALFGADLHADEALFATWARLIATWRDPLLRTVTVDKPPLLFYVQASLYPLIATAAPWAARLPGFMASVITIALTARLVWALYGDKLAAVVAATIVAFSPLLVSSGPTAFIDPFMSALVIAALVAIVECAADGQEVERGLPRPFVAGLVAALAVCSKYQALLFLLLIVVAGGLNGLDWRRMRRWLVGFALPLVSLLGWLVVRGGESNLWAQQMASFGGLRLAYSWELWSRLEAWGAQWARVLGAPVLAFALLLFLPLFLALLIQQQDRETAFDQLFLLFLLAYGLLHWFIAVPVWERYLLAVVPLVAVVLGRFVSRVTAFALPSLALRSRLVGPAIALMVALLLAPAAVEAGDLRNHDAHGRPGADSAVIARALAGAPYGTVLYDHWYSWHWRYFLLDSAVYVSWFPHPEALVSDLDAFLTWANARYLVLPNAATADVVRRTVRAGGYTLVEVMQATDMTLYRIRR